ncbi:MAG: hypothetical protein IKW45_06395, partial [Clostridia bacterium]|nr:hypothetical protein [Clostridia bacterium]
NSNTFGNDCYSNTFGNDCYSNTFGNDCYSNTFGNDCYSNTFGNSCNSNTFGEDANNSSEILDYCRYIIFENGVQYVNIRAEEFEGSYNFYLQNIKVCSGVQGNSQQNPLWLPEVGRDDNFQTTFKASGSKEVILDE